MENAGAKIRKTRTGPKARWAGSGLLPRGAAQAHHYSLAACRSETLDCSTTAARGPALGNVLRGWCAELSIISLPHRERRPRPGRLCLLPAQDAAGEGRGKRPRAVGQAALASASCSWLSCVIAFAATRLAISIRRGFTPPGPRAPARSSAGRRRGPRPSPSRGRQVEAALEGAGGDAAVQVTARPRSARFWPSTKTGVRLLDELDLVGREARDRHGDAVLVLARPLDVVGRPVVVSARRAACSSRSKTRSKPTVER